MRVNLPQEVRMRGGDRQQGATHSYLSPDARLPSRSWTVVWRWRSGGGCSRANPSPSTVPSSRPGPASRASRARTARRARPTNPGNPTVNFHGERRSNLTHASTTDPEARLVRKGVGREAKLGYQGHALMDNRHGLVVHACATQASGTAECAAAVQIVTAPPRHVA